MSQSERRHEPPYPTRISLPLNPGYEPRLG